LFRAIDKGRWDKVHEITGEWVDGDECRVVVKIRCFSKDEAEWVERELERYRGRFFVTWLEFGCTESAEGIEMVKRHDGSTWWMPLLP
jgi:hypothetical protein